MTLEEENRLIEMVLILSELLFTPRLATVEQYVLEVLTGP
jgi:hypothetical protein